MCSNSQGYYGSNNLLSPAAQAVLDAFQLVIKGTLPSEDRESLAAALRAVAEYVRSLIPSSSTTDAFDGGYVTGLDRAADELTAIATELENQ